MALMYPVLLKVIKIIFVIIIQFLVWPQLCQNFHFPGELWAYLGPSCRLTPGAVVVFCCQPFHLPEHWVAAGCPELWAQLVWMEKLSWELSEVHLKLLDFSVHWVVLLPSCPALLLLLVTTALRLAELYWFVAEAWMTLKFQWQDYEQPGIETEFYIWF